MQFNQTSAQSHANFVPRINFFVPIPQWDGEPYCWAKSLNAF